MPDRQQVVLVEADGHVIGSCEKLAAHEPPGRLHLAFSVFLFRPDGTTLVQQRSALKYHFPGIWANACCSHPEPGESLAESASRRVREELGLDCELSEVGVFVYRAVDPASGLVEHELDHVLVGETSASVLSPDPEEVQDWRFVPAEALADAGTREGYAPWFAEALRIALPAWRG